MEIKRNDAVTRMLEREGHPIGPMEIQQLLNAEGRKDKVQYVRNALTELRKSGRVVNVGHGKWTVPELVEDAQPKDEHASSPAIEAERPIVRVGG